MQIGRCHKDEHYFPCGSHQAVGQAVSDLGVIYIPFGMHKLGNMMEISGALWLAALCRIALFNIGTYFHHQWYIGADLRDDFLCHFF